jgi:hypothetical protein
MPVNKKWEEVSGETVVTRFTVF